MVTCSKFVIVSDDISFLWKWNEESCFSLSFHILIILEILLLYIHIFDILEEISLFPSELPVKKGCDISIFLSECSYFLWNLGTYDILCLVYSNFCLKKISEAYKCMFDHLNFFQKFEWIEHKISIVSFVTEVNKNWRFWAKNILMSKSYWWCFTTLYIWVWCAL